MRCRTTPVEVIGIATVMAAWALGYNDVLISVGAYSVFRFPVTPATVIAFLTILGFSLYDTIVVFDKLQDCGVIQQLARATPTVSLHIPWDKCSDWSELRQAAASAGLGFDAINSNTFSDQKGQAHSYKFGSLTHAAAPTRTQAVEHNIECIEIGRALGSQALTVWVGRNDHSRIEAVELYDHQTDPQENTNISEVAANKVLVEKLTAQWLAGWREAMPE